MMTDPALLNHIFLFYPGGAGGNFIGKVMLGAQYDQRDLILSARGGCHQTTDNYAFTWWNPPAGDNRSMTEKLGNMSADIEHPLHLSHDMDIIPAVREFCPNVKIMVVTTRSTREKVAAYLQWHSKYYLDGTCPGTNDYIVQWENTMKEKLIKLGVSPGRIPHRHNKEYFELLLHVSTEDYLSNVLNPTWRDPEDQYDISGCVELPYSVIMIHDTPRFITSIQACFKNELTSKQQQYITRNFDTYYDIQNKDLLDDPIGYLRHIKNKAAMLLTKITLP